MIYYSKTSKGFYFSNVHGDAIPNDAVAVNENTYKALMAGQSKGKQIATDNNGSPYLAEKALPVLNMRRDNAKTLIDTAAGNARQRFVSVGQLIDMEYKLAEQQTKEWRAAGSPAGDVPLAISDWAVAAGMTNEQAATDIEVTAESWALVLIAVRKIRLEGKAAIDAATDQGTADDMSNVAQPFIDQLDALKP